ncbi:membrane hypothetical protein [Verrucomicrobia bacterium]|nr:membrane hypothetical protein [Verrucomicrobiota bacterium]
MNWKIVWILLTFGGMIRKIICVNAVLIALLAAAFLVFPSLRVLADLRDDSLRGKGTPQAAWRLWRNLTPRYAAWARARAASNRAEQLSTNDVSGTEWPLFGSVFYLWGVENLQTAWEAGDHQGGGEPKGFAKDAIIAASELVVDPKQAAWVRNFYGEGYLHRDDLFYRMLVIAALASRERLLHDGVHTGLLREQVESLAQELDGSPSGLLEDYPGECYPGDVMAGVMAIKRADAVLGTDHSHLVNRELRAFTGERATRHGLPPYRAKAGTGLPASDARGCANAYMCLTAPELWPGPAAEWYAIYDRLFWQERLGAAGYREYAKGAPHSNWAMDVDAGPVLAGYGVAASAFGVGAARKNGRFDRAYPLTAELLATAVELPNGMLAVPRLLSNLSEAPLLGEAAILWQLSIQPEKGFAIKQGGRLPAYVYFVLIGMFLVGSWRILESVWTFRSARREEVEVWVPALQAVLWVGLLLGAIAAAVTSRTLLGLVLLLGAVLLPIEKKKRPPKGAEDWPEPAPVDKPADGKSPQ